jgi:hypothetical protein
VQIGSALALLTAFCATCASTGLYTLRYQIDTPSHTVAQSSPATAYIAMVVGLSIRVIPPAIAPPATPSSSALRAVPTATSEEEHAVSMASDGPFRPYRYDSRPGVQILHRLHPDHSQKYDLGASVLCQRSQASERAYVVRIHSLLHLLQSYVDRTHSRP